MRFTLAGMRSLERQLPLAAVTLLLAIAAPLTLVSYHEVREQAVSAAQERLARTTQQFAQSLEQTASRSQDAMSRLASDTALRTLLRPGDAGDRAIVSARLLATLSPRDSEVVVSVWDREATTEMASSTRGSVARWAGPPEQVERVSTTDIHAVDDTTLYYSIVAPVLEAKGETIGYVQRRTRLRMNPSTLQSIRTMIDPTATVLIVGRNGQWTDLRRVVPAPLAAADTSEMLNYHRAGLARQGIARAVPGTPWILVSDLPVNTVLRPIRGFLGRVGLIALVLVLTATLAASALGRRITRPLGELRDASAALAAGEYDRRVKPSGHPEIGRLAEAFNGMAAETDRQIHALQESEERFRSLATATAQIVWWTDAGGEVVDQLPTWQAFTGQRFPEVRGSGWTAALHPEDATGVLGAWERAVAARSLFEIDCRIRRYDGEYRSFVMRGVPMLQLDGTLRAWVGTCTDVTQRREAEESLRRKEAELRQAQRLDAIGRLAGGIAHDFNNLLTTIIGPAELAREQLPAGHPVLADLDDIYGAALRATELTKHLLAFCRQQVRNPVALDANKVVESAVRLLERLIGESIELELSLDPSGAVISVDPTQLEQVILNLTINARDAMPAGGRLTLRTAVEEIGADWTGRSAHVPPGRYVVLSVADTGIGMDEETRTHMFEPFFTTKEPGKGTGLGLATVYGIVRQSEGHLDVSSAPGQGTVVRIYLPEAEPEFSFGAPASGQYAVGGTETVLLAEDEPRLLAIGVRILGQLGYTVLPASSGPEALAVARRHAGPIDLLVSDVVMPGMNGLELWSQLKMEQPALPALFMSGWATDAVVRHGILDGQVPFLQKPFTPDGIGRKVREVIDQATGIRDGVERAREVARTVA